MLAVIMLHTSVCFNNLDNYLIANCMRTIGLMGVPLFFTVSGYLLLGKKNITYSYSLKKIYKICRYVFVFSILYWIPCSIFQQDFNIFSLIYGSFASLANRGFFPWFWYFGAMIIIYALVPIYKKVFNKNTYLGGVIPLAFIIVIQWLIFIYASNIHLAYMGINIVLKQYIWIGYFVIGGLIHHYNFKSTFTICILLFLINLGFQIYEIPILPQRTFYYASFPMLLLVVFFFYMIKNCTINKGYYIINWMSKLFVLVYSIHILVMKIISCEYFGTSIFSPLLYFFTISIITITISYVISRIPILNKALSL